MNNPKRNILAIVGSAGKNSTNLCLVKYLQEINQSDYKISIFNELKSLPHFDPDFSLENIPQPIIDLRNAIESSAGVLISTPEYIFSIPAGLKNAIEWCVASTVFTAKPVAIMTASLDGQKAHEELQLIMKTIMAKFTNETTLLASFIKSKVNEKGVITDSDLRNTLNQLFHSFISMIEMPAYVA